MATRKKTPEKKAEAAGPSVAGTVNFDRVGITRLSFLEIGLPKPVEQRGAPEISLSTAASFRVQDNRAEVKLHFKIAPGADARPYAIELEMVGEFSTTVDHKEILDPFCRVNAPAIMMPYVRQIVHTLSGAARFGAVKLPLLNTRDLFRADNWTDEPQPIADPYPVNISIGNSKQ